MLLKQSPQTPLCADIFAQTLHEAGIPQDVLQVTHVDDQGANYLVQHPQIKFVNFTGSIEIGKKIRKAISDSGKLIGKLKVLTVEERMRKGHPAGELDQRSQGLKNT